MKTGTVNSTWGKRRRRVNEVVWLYLGLSGTAAHGLRVQGWCAGWGVSRDLQAKLVGKKFLSGCCQGVHSSLIMPTCVRSPKGQGAGKIHKRGFLPLFWMASMFSLLSLWEIKWKQNQNTHTKDCSVHEAGAAPTAREERLSLNPSMLSFYPRRPWNASLVPVCVPCRIPCVPMHHAGHILGMEGGQQHWPWLWEIHEAFPPPQWQHM